MIKDILKNSEVYDKKFELKNINYEDLLDKVVGQALLIEDLESSYVEHIKEIEELKDKNKNLETSLLILNK